MNDRTRAWVVLLGLAAATGLGACFAANEDTLTEPSSPTAGPGGGNAGGAGGVGAGPIEEGGSEPGTDYGETAPINGPMGGEFADPPEACADLDQETDIELYPSANDSNSMASPALARELLEAGLAPTRVRTHEFLNYYRGYYPGEAPPTDTLALFVHGEQRTEQGFYDLQIGVRSYVPSSRPPMTVTFVLDASGSMEGDGLDRERAVIRAVAESLRVDDVVNMVTCDTTTPVLMSGHGVTGANDQPLLDAAEALTADAGTDLYGGLLAGYALAAQHLQPQTEGLNTVLLVSDGGTNIGVTEQTLIAELTTDGDQQGIHLVGVGIGPAEEYNDRLMRAVTDQGRAAYVYVDTQAEARQLFVERFDEVMMEAADAVQVRLVVPWYFEVSELLGEQRTDHGASLAQGQLAPSDTMLLHQTIAACAPEVVVPDEARMQVHVDWEDPVDHQPMDSTSLDFTLQDLIEQDQAPLRKGQAVVAYAEALQTGTAIALQQALAVVEMARADVSDPELDDIARLIQLHPAFLQQ